MNLINLTESAQEQVKKLCEEHGCYAITLDIKGGGCAGFEYEWGTAQKDQVESNDYVVECDTGAFVVSSYSVMYLAGSDIDYVKNLMGSTFEVKNPNAASSCGCGVSVNFHDDFVPHFME